MAGQDMTRRIDSGLGGRHSRRDVLRGAAALGLGAAALGGRRAAAQDPVQIDFMSWSYSIETIQDNIAKFQERNPGITVNYTDFPWFDYPDVMAARFLGDNAPDVAYNSDHWLTQWADADWVVPLDDHCPNLLQYAADFAPYSIQGMTYNDKLYGLPYYSDLVVFFQNAAMAEQAGFSAAPQTWDEVRDQALAIKEQGIVEYPVNIPLAKADPWTIEFFYSMVYSEGGHFFDENNEPVFNQAGSPAEKVLQWLHDALNTWKIMNPAALEVVEPDVVKSLVAGESASTILAKYNLAAVNTSDGAHKGAFKLAMMPGSTHETTGFVRFYTLTRHAVDRGAEALDAACKFLDYNGGKTDGVYVVQKRWAIEKGLGFAVLPLYDDPEVAASISSWGDVALEREQATKARIKEGLTAWWGTWDVFAREQIHNAVSSSTPPADALTAMADKWSELRGYYGG
jgi:multiple sugar transport system substrate-binding protein